jgi:Ca-activated chloride channel homolog
MTALQLFITPQRPALLAGIDNEMDVLVRVQAPSAPKDLPVKMPLNLALVIDRSGSMSGQPLAEAKRCAEMIIENLNPKDMVSLVTYDSHVRIPVPFREVVNRSGLRQAIRTIESCGLTALYDGWYEGAGQAAHGAEQAGVSRVLLLSDGQANRGLTDTAEISSRCAKMAEVGVTTSTYGLGHHFNEDLMVQMARAGNGSSYYGQTAEDLMDPFREEFELLQNLCATKLRLQLTPAKGVTAEVLNGYSKDESGHWRLPDPAYGGEAWAAVRLRIPVQVGNQATHAEATPILDVSLFYEDLGGQNQQIETCKLSLPWLPAEDYQALGTDPIVAERFGELRAADLQEKARNAARRGDWNQVDSLLEQARQGAIDNPWLQHIIETLQGYAARRETEPLSKEAMYASRNIRTRLADSEQVAGSYDVTMESEKLKFLRRKMERGKRF